MRIKFYRPEFEIETNAPFLARVYFYLHFFSFVKVIHVTALGTKVFTLIAAPKVKIIKAKDGAIDADFIRRLP